MYSRMLGPIPVATPINIILDILSDYVKYVRLP